MATVSPFRGVRYNPDQIQDLSSVVTPPYDVIDTQAQKKYYKKNPYNVIRLELGYQYAADNEQDNRYLRAAADYRTWLAQNILIQEKRPALYLYEQEFTVGNKIYSRTGFFARVKLEEYATGKILPHEETLASPKADRLALLSACKANFSPVFAYYEDPTGELDAGFAKIKISPPDIDITDEMGEKHRLWAITDPSIHSMAAASFKDKVLYIADGHHRYETALTYYRTTNSYADSLLMYLVNTSDPGLVILPTHRIVHNLGAFQLAPFLEQLQRNFTLEKIDLPGPEQIQGILEKREQLGEVALIMGTREPATYLLILKNKDSIRACCPSHSQAWCDLDVAALHILIFSEILGINPERMSQQENLMYTRDEAEALKALYNREGELAFFLNPTRIEQITAVAATGDKMPQKSTYFYPKLLTGLIINDLTG